MKKINIIKSNEEFNLVMNKGRCLKNKYFVLYINDNNENKYRFGISVGKKITNAVGRNKLKRQVRNILDYHKNIYSNNKDYIIIVRKSSLGEKYNILEENLVKIIEKAGESGEKYE